MSYHIGPCALFALVQGRCVSCQVHPFPQCLALGLSTLHPRCVLCLGHKCLHEVQHLVAAVFAGSLEQAFPICDCLGKSMVGWPHCTAQRHYTQHLIPLSSLGHCSCADSIVHSGSVKALGEHGICSIVFTQCWVHWDDGEPRCGGINLITLPRWWQRWPIRVDLHGHYGQWCPQQRCGITWRSQQSWWRHHYLWCLSWGPHIAT